ncbi:MAG: hypothetical protein FWE13_03855 [Firmicutes bacterium]|nr:hypothetical protein [Bacillota bacterium]
MAKKRKNIIEHLQQSIELDTKKTPSDTILSTVGILTGTLAGLLVLICLILYLAIPRPPVGIDFAEVVWYFIYYPSVVLVIVGLFCTVGQLFRNHYISTIIGLIINTSVAIALITVSLVQGIAFGQVLVFPFWFL